MRLQPRLQILETWRSIAQYAVQDGKWVWGGRDGRNSIGDAEQLLCLLYPATEVQEFALYNPDATAFDVVDALRPLGDSVSIPKTLIAAIADYMTTYTAEDGTPIFSGGEYFHSADSTVDLTKSQRDLDVVTSHSMSLSLCLATLAFLKTFGRVVRRRDLLDEIAALEEATSTRLSAAMIGLLRSFCVYTFTPSSDSGRALLRTLNQDDQPSRVVLDDLRRGMQSVRAALREAVLGMNQDHLDTDDSALFECGWSWGVVQNAPVVDTTEPVGKQLEGMALAAPYLHFTLIALDGITDLFSDRTQVLGLLNPEQQRLAQALQLRLEISVDYWSRMARFGSGRWPLEDIPWRTTDHQESTYFSVLITAVVLLDLLQRRSTERDFARTVGVIENLALLGRINLRVVPSDPAATLHHPGVEISLYGSETLGPLMSWIANDYSALLLKHTARAAGLSRNSSDRERLLIVAESALAHLWRRRLTHGPAAGLWDDPHELVPDAQVDLGMPSWHLTERMIEALVIAAYRTSFAPEPSAILLEVTSDLLSQADHLLSQEQLMSELRDVERHTRLKEIEGNLQRARRLTVESPGVAHAIVVDVLRELGTFAASRREK